MQYNDSIRQYNFLAGLGFGVALGVGLARLVLPQKKVLRRQVRGANRRLRSERSGRSSGAVGMRRGELPQRSRAEAARMRSRFSRRGGQTA